MSASDIAGSRRWAFAVAARASSNRLANVCWLSVSRRWSVRSLVPSVFAMRAVEALPCPSSLEIARLTRLTKSSLGGSSRSRRCAWSSRTASSAGAAPVTGASQVDFAHTSRAVALLKRSSHRNTRRSSAASLGASKAISTASGAQSGPAHERARVTSAASEYSCAGAGSSIPGSRVRISRAKPLAVADTSSTARASTIGKYAAIRR